MDVDQLIRKHPLLKNIMSLKEVIWFNPNLTTCQEEIDASPLGEDDVIEAEQRLKRFAPYIEKAFPETNQAGGIIESPLLKTPSMKQKLEESYNVQLDGELYVKCDSHLPISGSIKARGGIYEVLKHAETLAFDKGMLSPTEDYSKFNSETFREFFSTYSIAVGSTGNLGLSIGIISAALGFNVTVHMSADAKEWKKSLLQSKGVTVVEYESDYSKAVEEGRREAEQNPNCHFIDDENSTDLFLGYAVAGLRLKKQLDEQGIAVNEDHPLFVYLPCGVGGGPGGVAFGLKLAFKENVHCFFAKPTHSPAMLLGMMTGLHDNISVQDVGIDNITAADGLAVGRPSRFVGKLMDPLLSGAYTINDENMYRLLKDLADTEELFLEPSALAGMIGPIKLTLDGEGYLNKQKLHTKINHATHIVWATGGSMVPEKEMQEYYQIGFDLDNK